MGLLQQYYSSMMLLGEYERQTRASPRVPRRHHEGNSPCVGRKVNSHWNSAQLKRSHSRLTDSDCQLSSSETEDCGELRTRYRYKRKQTGSCVSEPSDDNDQKRFNSAAETPENMALNAVMMSGHGSLATKRSSSQRHLPDIDSEIAHGNDWGPAEDSTDQGSTSASSSPNSVKCICDKIRSKQTVIINVGGQVFETYKSTLRRLKSCKLSKDSEMAKYYRVDNGDYFFDRDPYAFNIILNYLRYGDLHLPTNLCGPALMREFEFWGVDEQDIERCCFQPYNTWKTQTKSLEKLEYDRKQSTTQTDLAQDRNSKSVWRRLRAVVWTFLQDPNSSVSAKVYAYISVIFVALSIFSFCAETHPFFQLPPSEVHDFRTLYRIFTLEDSQTLHFKNGDSSDDLNGTFSSNKTGTSTNVTYTEGIEPTVQHPALLIIDLMCVFFFSLEFLTRLVFCPKKLRFCTSLQNIIDFVAIVPDYVEFIILSMRPSIGHGLPFVDFIFILRMLRLCRIFRLIRHVPGLWILLYTLKASFNELMLMFVFLLIGMVMFASLLHFIEGGKTFNNIPVGFWWAVVTMTTVGYGDMVPVTAYGYIIGSLCAISGLLMIAFTVPIIVSNFVLYYTHVQYGISDKDFSGSKIHELGDETETCSYHTTYTETSEDQKTQTVLKEGTNSQISSNASLRRSRNNSLKSNRKCDKLNEEKLEQSPFEGSEKTKTISDTNRRSNEIVVTVNDG